MKRGGFLPRRTPLQAKTPLRSTARLVTRTPLRQVSRKRSTENQARVKVVAELKARQVRLVGYVHCQRCGKPGPVDAHELLSRARGGSIVDKANIRLLCRSCHDDVTFRHHEIPDADQWIHSRKGT